MLTDWTCLKYLTQTKYALSISNADMNIYEFIQNLSLILFLQDGEFHGVMRFYFQEAGAKVATKCIRVASSATGKAVIETLVEKFRPDMRMLSIPQYALYEIHENGEERRLEDNERPLLVQLNWHSDDREGRFLLRRIDEKVELP